MRDFIAGLLDIVQNDVQVEPPLQEIKKKNPLNTEKLQREQDLTSEPKAFGETAKMPTLKSG